MYTPRGLRQCRAECLQSLVAIFHFSEFAGHFFAKGDDLGDGLAVFALQAIEQGEAVFNFGQPLGRGIDALGVVAERGADIADGGAGGLDLLGGFSELRVVAGQFFDIATAAAEQLRRKLRLRRAGRRRSWQRSRAFRRWRGRAFRFRVLRLRRLRDWRRSISLRLIAPQVDHAQAVLLAVSSSSSLACAARQRFERLGDRVGRDAGEAVEQDALLGLVEAGECFSLRVDQRELGRKLPENGDGGGLVVDEDAAFAGGQNFAAQNDFVAFGVDAVFFEDRFGAGVDSKTQATTALSAPWRTISAEDLPPMRSASASTRIDLPAPVSPVSRLRPGPKTAMA